MLMDRAKWPVLDRVLEDRLAELPPGNRHNLLRYTSSLHRSWRAVLQMLQLPTEWSVLDVGCGYGILGFELAGQASMRVHGVDIEEDLVEDAKRIAEDLEDLGYFQPGSQVTFEVGDAMGLPVADHAYDFTVVRELLQFLPDPGAAVDEFVRVTVPGGHICLSDIDDQLYLTYPDPSPALTRLHGVFRQAQEAQGGDRSIGRKLSTLLVGSGCEVASVVIVPEAQHLVASGTSFERDLIIAQLEDARDRIVTTGLISADEFDANLAAVRAEPHVEQFRTNARVVVIARTPVGDPDR
ncbi:MAG: methyltransferase domain-containing protein [Acidimicrobiales bacterium]|jgi:ubiquinone/menaquinone biosynthesis C-methylase UbiE